MKAVLNPTNNTSIIVGLTSIIILVMFESIKRFVFDRFSMSFIKNRNRFSGSEVLILTLISSLLITGSFYLSLNGAKNYSSRDKEIMNIANNDISKYSDSLNNEYNVLVDNNDSIFNSKIKILENNNIVLFADNRKYDTYIEDYTKKYNELSTETWQERQEKIRIKQEIKDFRKEKEKNSELIDKNDSKIESFNKKRDEKNKSFKNDLDIGIKKYESEKKLASSDKIEDNKSNSFKFLIFSTIIEFIILFGIYFPHHYEYRSVSEYDEKIKSDPNYKKFHSWNTLLDIILSDNDQIGKSLPYKKDMMKLLSANKVDMSVKDFDDSLKIFVHLGILKTKGNKKTINCDLQTGRDVIMKYLKIE